MASHQITHTRKDKDDDITHVVGKGYAPFDHTSALAIQKIRARTDSYYTSVNGRQVGVKVYVSAAGKPFLRTDRDQTTTNNLDNLPRA